MMDWTKARIGPSATIREAIATIDAGAMQIALVVDADHVLQGVVTDGDIRRGILRGLSLEDPVTLVMNANPTTAREHDDREALLSLMRQRHLHHIPVLDSRWRVVGIELMDELLQPERRPSPVVLMAGGLGTRLRPLTDELPKPMLKVGSRPILETILSSLIEHGFYQFYFSVNYKAELIEEYFGRGERWQVEISYLREHERLGTAGALSLLPGRPEAPLLVMNGDLLTKLNFGHLVDFHTAQQAAGTMCVREYVLQVPYGVVEADDSRILQIREKPVHRYLVNAGVYVLQPEVLSYLPKGTYFDMPSLFEEMIARQQRTAVFPIREYWMDIGRMDDFQQANGEYRQVFEG